MTPKMYLHSGRWVDPLALDFEDIDPMDIAHHLCLINRYNGATPFPFSVAQHSILVAYVLPRELKLWGLLHDAAEAYVGDVIHSIKSRTEEILAIETQALLIIAKRFNLPLPVPERITTEDLRIGATECKAFGIKPNHGRDAQPYDYIEIGERDWRVVKIEFLQCLSDYGGMH